MPTTCEVKDCGGRINFHGYGHDFCWKHYSDWLISFKASNSERHPQITFTFGDMPDYASEEG